MGPLTLRRRLTLLVALTIVVPITAVGITVVNLIGNEAEQRSFERLRQAAAFTKATLTDSVAAVSLAAATVASDRGLEAALAGEAAGPPSGDSGGSGGSSGGGGGSSGGGGGGGGNGSGSGSASTDGGTPGAPGDPAVVASLRALLDRTDVDAIVVTDTPTGQVLVSARREARFAPGVVAPTDADLVARAAGARAVVASQASAAPATFGVTVARWNDRARLEDIARAPGVTIAVLDGRNLVASTTSLGSLPAGSLLRERTARFGGRTLESVGTTAPRVGVTVLALTRPSAAANRGRLLVIFALLLGVLVILVVLVGHVVSGLVTGPVDRLVEAAQAVSRGDFDRHVVVAGDAEIAALGRAFNQMTVDLREQVRELAQSRNDFRTAIARLGDVLVSTHDIAGIIDVVLEAALLTTKGEQAVFFERIAMPARIRASAVHGAEQVPAVELNGTGIAGTAARLRAPVTFPGEELLAPGEPAVAAAVAVPVVSDGRLFGVIAVYGRRNESLFGEEDAHTLQTLARQAEVAIGNVMLHDETQRQARTDGTTGLWNRREFELRAREAVREAERFHEPFGVILVDVDDFKRINDRWDHSTGDAALIWVASRLSEATREIDLVARWGGEEFIVLLPRAGADETRIVAERVRSVIAREPMVDGDVTIHITVSAGYAIQPYDGRTADDLFKAADAALARAKRRGKNRVERAVDDQGVAQMSEGSQ